MIEFLGWLVHLFEFLLNRPSLHLTVTSVGAFDTRNQNDILCVPLAGWQVEFEIANRGRRTTTVTDVWLFVDGEEVGRTELREDDRVFDEGRFRRVILDFSQYDLRVHAQRYEFRIRDAFGKVIVRRGACKPPSIWR